MTEVQSEITEQPRGMQECHHSAHSESTQRSQKPLVTSHVQASPGMSHVFNCQKQKMKTTQKRGNK